MRWIRHLYDWVLGWAESRYGAVALFFFAVAESVFFPVPPDVLLLALALGCRTRAWRFALICSVGSVVGGAAGYALGYAAWMGSAGFTPLAAFFFDHVPGFSRGGVLRRSGTVCSVGVLDCVFSRVHANPLQDFHDCRGSLQYSVFSVPGGVGR